MLMPKRVKHRKVHRGRMKGKANSGNLSFIRRLRLSGNAAFLDHKQPDRSGSCCDDALYQEGRTGLD